MSNQKRINVRLQPGMVQYLEEQKKRYQLKDTSKVVRKIISDHQDLHNKTNY